MGAREIYLLEIVQKVVIGKAAMDNSSDMVEWKKQNSAMADLISAARNEAIELNLVGEND